MSSFWDKCGAISQMDSVTQQNAALVEEASAAASSLDEQAQQLVRSVSVFKIDNASHALATPPPAEFASRAPGFAASSRRSGRPATGSKRAASTGHTSSSTATLVDSDADGQWNSF